MIDRDKITVVEKVFTDINDQRYGSSEFRFELKFATTMTVTRAVMNICKDQAIESGYQHIQAEINRWAVFPKREILMILDKICPNPLMDRSQTVAEQAAFKAGFNHGVVRTKGEIQQEVIEK